MGNESSTPSAPSTPSHLQHVANRLHFRDLPHFTLKGKRELLIQARLTEFAKIFYPLQDLLVDHYDDRFNGVFRLSPADNLQVDARIKGAFGGEELEGQASFDFDDKESFYVTGGLGTAPKPTAFGTFRYLPKSRDRNTSLFVRGNVDLEKALNKIPTIGAGVAVTKKNLAFEVFGTTASEVGGFLILQPSPNLKVAASGKLDVRNSVYKDGEIVVSLTGEKGLGKFSLNCGIADLGRSISASFVQNLKMPSKLTGYNHNITLGGEYKHLITHGASPDKTLLTLGGAWQLTSRSVIKAKLDTKGNASALLGFQIGHAPMCTFVGTVQRNFVDKTNRFGLSFVFED